MSFSSGARNDFAQRKVPAPDLIPVPRYGWLYRLTFECGHTYLSGQVVSAAACAACGMSRGRVAWEMIREG